MHWKKRKKLRKLAKKPLRGTIAKRPHLYKIYVQCKCFDWICYYGGTASALINSCQYCVRPVREADLEMPPWAYNVKRYKRVRRIKLKRAQIRCTVDEFYRPRLAGKVDIRYDDN